MKTLVTCAMFAALVVASGGAAWAQQHGPRPDPSPAPAMTMEMCQQMMGHRMAGGPMGHTGSMGHMGRMGHMGMMPTMMSGDPKHDADAMEMHGEMMKAMGDIMMKYAGRMRQAK